MVGVLVVFFSPTSSPYSSSCSSSSSVTTCSVKCHGLPFVVSFLPLDKLSGCAFLLLHSQDRCLFFYKVQVVVSDML